MCAPLCAFVRMKKAALRQQDLAKRLSELQDKIESLAMQHDTLAAIRAANFARCLIRGVS